ncbi:Inhibitor of apoptosis-promoting Bax1-related protein, partial [Coemansia erecta]
FIEKAFSHLELEFNDALSPRFRFRRCPIFISPLEYPTDKLVKTVHIPVISWNLIARGDLYNWMLESECTQLVFSSARSLVISQQVCSPAFCLANIDTGVAVQNISVILRLFRMMTPNISEIDLRWHPIEYPDKEGELYVPVMQAISDIIDSTKVITIDAKKVFHKASFADMAIPSDLTSFTFTFGAESRWYDEVIRRNSQSLKKLELLFYLDADVSMPLYDKTDSLPIVYSSLDTLKLLYAGNLHVRSLPIPKKTGSLSTQRTVHFPYLQVFESTVPYPFAYNVLPDTLPSLERLSIYIPEDIVESRPTFEHLASSRFPNLRALKIHGYTNYTGRMVQPNRFRDPALLKFLPKILDPASLQYFKVDCPMDKTQIFEDAYMVSMFANLRVIEIQYVTLLFREILWLLQTAPNLERLYCRPHQGAPDIDGVRPEKLPEYIHGMRPLNKRFMWLETDDIFSGLPSRNQIKTALLLAIGCPNFTRLSYPFISNDTIRKIAESVMKTKPFVNHADGASSFINNTKVELLKVYSTLGAAVGSSMAGCYSAARLPLFDPTSLLTTLLLFALTVSLYLLPARSSNLSLRTTLFMSLAWLMGGAIEPLVSGLMYTGQMDVLLGAGILTLVMFVGFSVGVMAAERARVAYLVGAVTTALGVLSWIAILGVYYQPLVSLALVVGLTAGCVNLVVQTDDMIVRAEAGVPVDSITTALGFFTSLVAIFVRLAVILSREKQRSSNRSTEQRRKKKNGAWQGSQSFRYARSGGISF